MGSEIQRSTECGRSSATRMEGRRTNRACRDRDEPSPDTAYCLLIAGATQLELTRYVRYLKIENEILRSKLPQRVAVTPKERNRLVKFGAKLGKGLTDLVTIVHPDTLRQWIRDSKQKARKKPVKKGRPRTQEQIAVKPPLRCR